MEREPKENNDTQNGEQGSHTLFDFFGHCPFLLGGIRLGLHFGLFARSRKTSLVSDKNYQRDNHSDNRRYKRIVNTLVKNLKIVLTSTRQFCHVTARCRHKGIKVIQCSLTHLGSIVNELVAKCRKLGIIGHSVRSQPPFSQKGRNKRSNQTTHINKYIKNLESAIPFAFRNLQSLMTLFCSLCLKIVIQLPHNSLQISLKQTITKSYHKQCKTGKRKQPSYIRTRC